MTILTGTRCTTLTKLPVAFSTGKADEFRAGAQLNAVDMAAQFKRGIGVDLDARGWSRAHHGRAGSP